MRIGIGSWTYGWSAGVRGYPAPDRPLTAMDLVRRAIEFGVPVVQIADNLPLHLMSNDELRELRGLAASGGIEIQPGTASVNPDNLLRYLDFARCFGSGVVRSLLADIDSRPDLAQSELWIREVLPAFESAGVCLALENYERYTSRELAAFVRRIDSPYVGICLDTVNSLGALETPAEVVRELGPYVRNLHVKDFMIERIESRMGYMVSGRPAGEGLLNVDWLLEQLRAAGGEFDMILELWTPYRGSVEETIRMEEDWADRSVRFLCSYAS